MQYIDGNPVRGNYKAPNWQETHKRTGWEKAGSAANTAGYAIGLASTAREVYTAARPVLQGVGLLMGLGNAWRPDYQIISLSESGII